ncbi:MAG: Txe/YoeB family addiction module toxin [Selenomonadaceae bacterium]|nr:Txe/YoeB family addiction module toxin [Selenomonadaceae bacterium]
MICFAEGGWQDYLYWQNTDKKVVKKINNLLKSIERDGVMQGEGKPEKLKRRIGVYSRRIDDTNRLTYTFENSIITVIKCRSHYDDK